MSKKQIKEDAKEVWNELKEKNPLFPWRSCKFAAIEMHKKGYPIVVGSIHFDNYCCMKIEKNITHYWNYDPKSGKYIDLTIGSYYLYSTRRLPEILILHPENDLVKAIYSEIKRDIEPSEII